MVRELLRDSFFVLQRLPEQIKEKNEKMKEEMIGN